MPSILMPALSPTMEEGKLAKWLKKVGDKVKSGDVIAEIETDKATMEVEAVDEGTLSSILVPEGTESVKVNTPIAVIGEAVRRACDRQTRRAQISRRPKSPHRSASPSRRRLRRRRQRRSPHPIRKFRQAPKWSR